MPEAEDSSKTPAPSHPKRQKVRLRPSPEGGFAEPREKRDQPEWPDYGGPTAPPPENGDVAWAVGLEAYKE